MTNDKVTLFWSETVNGQTTAKSRYNCTATVSGNNVVLSSGAGSALPADDTAVVLCKQTELTARFLYAGLAALLAKPTRRGLVQFLDASSNVLFAVDLAGNETCQWVRDTGLANPLTADVASIRVANGDAVAACEWFIVALYDATP